MKQAGMNLDGSRGDRVCPFLTQEDKCGARQHRALGCRTYFRIVADREGAEALYEKYHGEIKTICVQEGIPWEYQAVLPALRREGQRPSAREDGAA